MNARTYALASAPQLLPAPATLRPAMYSVPRPDGGYDYYEAPPGSSVPLNDDLPLPIIAHANPIGVSVLTLGRPLPPGSRKVGSGGRAKGSLTAMPGVRADGPLTSGLGGDGLGYGGYAGGFGSLTSPNDEDVRIAGRAGLLAIGIASALAAAVVWKASRLPSPMRHTLDIQRFRASTPKAYTPKGAHEETTHRLRQTFMGDKRPPQIYDTHASWAGLRFRHIGANMGTAYASDKWGGEKKKSFEEFLHISEAPQELYMREGALTDFPTFGPIWNPAKDRLTLPDVVADLAPIMHLNARLFTSLDSRGQGVFGEGDKGCRRIAVGASMLCAGYLIDADDPDYGEPFLVVIAKKGGVQALILGKKLDVTKDGITG